MNYRKDIDKLEATLKDLKNKQEIIEKNCGDHEWVEPVYDPYYNVEEIWDGTYSGTGDDLCPRYVKQKVKKDRWKRECVRCGKTEITHSQKPTAYVPDFKE